jgi:DNA-binding NtrC family response regulator
MITGHASLDSAVEAMKAGAYHYLAKPFRLAEAREVVRAALELRRVKRENQDLKLRIEQLQNPHTLITQDLGMQRLLETARQIATSDSSVVIHGESGTGKELLARYIHQSSRRAEGPFVAFNCGALSEDLAASELFGHEKGAFTGAQARKLGLFEAANGGTLFLDEVAELPPSVQIKLLRVLQEREVLRVGASSRSRSTCARTGGKQPRPPRKRSTPARCATTCISASTWSRCRCHRLRERRDDIPLLAYFLLRKFAVMMDRPLKEITPEAMQRLVEYDYPGNVRELSNFIERGVALAQGEQLGVEHLPQHLGKLTVRVFAPMNWPRRRPRWRRRKRSTSCARSKLAKGNRSEAARMLGIDRVSLWRKLKKFGL